VIENCCFGLQSVKRSPRQISCAGVSASARVECSKAETVDPSALEPRLHEPPAGWSRETFEAVTDALAAALVAAYRRIDLDALIEKGKAMEPAL